MSETATNQADGGEGAESAEEMTKPTFRNHAEEIAWHLAQGEERECWDCGAKFTRKLSEPLLKGGMCVRCYVSSKL